MQAEAKERQAEAGKYGVERGRGNKKSETLGVKFTRRVSAVSVAPPWNSFMES